MPEAKKPAPAWGRHTNQQSSYTGWLGKSWVDAVGTMAAYGALAPSLESPPRQELVAAPDG